MYIRSKVAKGHTYYQVVEGKREGGRVRQRVVCALGTNSTLAAALAEFKVRLAKLRRWRTRLGNPSSKALIDRGAQLDRMIADLAARVELLKELQKTSKVSTTPRPRDGSDDMHTQGG